MNNVFHNVIVCLPVYSSSGMYQAVFPSGESWAGRVFALESIVKPDLILAFTPAILSKIWIPKRIRINWFADYPLAKPGQRLNCYNLCVSKIKKPKFDGFQPSQDKESFFDDCPVCQVMKFANQQGRNPTETELLQAFRQAKKSGAPVGGKWFENKNL